VTRLARHEYAAAPAGTVIVVQAGDRDFAVAGGNVRAWARQRGIAGFIVDGLIRDVGKVRELRFLVFSRGVIPIPGDKKGPGTLGETVTCGGVSVAPGDIAVADEEGIVLDVDFPADYEALLERWKHLTGGDDEPRGERP